MSEKETNMSEKETKKWVNIDKDEHKGVLGLNYGKQFGFRGE